MAAVVSGWASTGATCGRAQSVFTGCRNGSCTSSFGKIESTWEAPAGRFISKHGVFFYPRDRGVYGGLHRVSVAELLARGFKILWRATRAFGFTSHQGRHASRLSSSFFPWFLPSFPPLAGLVCCRSTRFSCDRPPASVIHSSLVQEGASIDLVHTRRAVDRRMTLKCWTSAIREPQPTDDVTEMQYSASSGSSGTVGSATIPAPSGPSTISIVTTSARPHPTSQSFTEFRRRSVGFIHTTPLVPDDGLQGLAMTPTRNYHKANRYRSLSSNWDKMDSDEDSEVSEHEEKHGENGSTDQRRRDLMFTPMTSIGRHFSNNQTAHHDFHTRRRAHGPKSARNRRRRTMSESSGSASRRVRILSPASSKVFFCGWVRGQSAEVRWEVVDKSVQSVRIDVCNVAWAVPTTIAHRVPNDGYFQWKRVYWGMPITDGYYVNIYDVTDLPPEEQQTESSAPQPNQQENQDKDKTEKIELALLARSECFAVVG